ncbi:MAG: YeeE/YedE family protein [Burkholderiales bacterium]|nr:YeeE/YedE family protein [Burkholderiales bacterium]
MTDSTQLAALVAWGAFALGFVFGLVGNMSNFCTMGAVSDVVNMGDWNRMRMWLLAMAVAVLGTGALQALGLVDVAKTIYTGRNLLWLSHAAGGLAFGVGMTLASGCGAKSLIRAGAGNLKSLVVLIVMGIAAYATLRGVLGVFRVWAIDPVAIRLEANQDLPSLASAAFGWSRAQAAAVLAALVGFGLLGFVFGRREFLTSSNLLGGIVIGLTVTGGFYLSGHVGYLAEDPATLEERFVATNTGRMESLSFVAPQAFLLELLMFWSDKSRIVTFGIAAILGICCGSLAWALATRSFRLESFRDPQDLLNHLAGAVLMGFGGVLALGCTVGQGISGVSTLALGSILTFFSIVAGAAATMKVQYWRM